MTWEDSRCRGNTLNRQASETQIWQHTWEEPDSKDWETSSSRSHECVSEITPELPLFAQRAAWVISNPAWAQTHRETSAEDCGNVWSDLTPTSSFLLKWLGLMGSQTDAGQVSTVKITVMFTRASYCIVSQGSAVSHRLVRNNRVNESVNQPIRMSCWSNSLIWLAKDRIWKPRGE